MTKAPQKDWPLRPLAVTWYRGPAWIDGEDIVVDRSLATTYHPLAESEVVGIELARVLTPNDAVAFVCRFGLLREPLSRPGQSLRPLREPFTLFETTADELRYILETARLVRRGDDGDPDAIRQLRERVFIPEAANVSVRDETTGEEVTRRAGDVYSPEERFEGADDRTILMYAHEHYVAYPLTEGFVDSRPCAYDRAFMGESVPPGTLRMGIRPDSLSSVCYLSVALALADRHTVGVCADATCGRPFFIADRRQRFCSRACGNRVRLRRFMDRHRHGDDAEGG